MRFSTAPTCSFPGSSSTIERAGVHSGDSISVYPVQRIDAAMEQRIADVALTIARELQIRGLINIQFVIHDEKLYIIEANPRASRTVPIIQKATGINPSSPLRRRVSRWARSCAIWNMAPVFARTYRTWS